MMYIHIGERQTVSVKTIIGIFNRSSLIHSSLNEKLLSEIRGDVKTVIVTDTNQSIGSKISSETIIKRHLDTYDSILEKKR